MAIEEGADIQVNHRYKYRGQNLGTFLTAARATKDKARLKKIKSIGLNLKLHSNKPEDYVSKYIQQLTKAKKPNKQSFTTRFNIYVLPKKDILKTRTIERLNKVWKRKFGDTRKWEKPKTTGDKINNWKTFRYDAEVNPTGKWLEYEKNMGKLYAWVYARKRNPEKMNLILDYFDDKEISELKNEGFLNSNTDH